MKKKNAINKLLLLVTVFCTIGCTLKDNEYKTLFICYLTKTEIETSKAEEIISSYENDTLKRKNLNRELNFLTNKIGLGSNNEIYSFIDDKAGMNAFYFSNDKTNFIVLGSQLLNKLKSTSETNIPTANQLFTLLHELGHFVKKHKESNYANELAADAYAGEKLAIFYKNKIGEIEVISKLFDVKETDSHPSKEKRMSAILDAYKKANEQNVNVIDIIPSPNEQFEAEYPMLKIKGEYYCMGSRNGNSDPDADLNIERPQHKVKVLDFKIGKFEVSQELWKKYMGNQNNPSNNSDCDLCPVEGITLAAAKKFAEKVSDATQNYYRLPTEEEWEFAAQYKMSEEEIISLHKNNINEISWNVFNSEKLTKPIGRKRHNKNIELYDMIGNVYEWTTSKYVKYDETDGSESNQFVIRGGGVYNSENDLKGYRIRHRNKQMYTGRFQGTGFRLVQEFTK